MRSTKIAIGIGAIGLIALCVALFTSAPPDHDAPGVVIVPADRPTRVVDTSAEPSMPVDSVETGHVEHPVLVTTGTRDAQVQGVSASSLRAQTMAAPKP